MKKKLIIITAIIIYIGIGLFFYAVGYRDGSFPENVFTFFYVVFLWPFVIGKFIVINLLTNI